MIIDSTFMYCVHSSKIVYIFYIIHYSHSLPDVYIFITNPLYCTKLTTHVIISDYTAPLGVGHCLHEPAYINNK